MANKKNNRSLSGTPGRNGRYGRLPLDPLRDLLPAVTKIRTVENPPDRWTVDHKKLIAQGGLCRVQQIEHIVYLVARL